MDIFQKHLIKGETVLWQGQPEVDILFSSADIFLVPFSLLWGGFAIFWEVSVFRTISSQPEAIFGALFGIPFVLIGLYFMFGRFVYKKWKKLRTWYAITDKRILIVTKAIRENIQILYINTLPTLNKNIRSSGVGTVKFSNAPYMVGMYDNSGMELLGSFYGSTLAAFHDIKEAEQVFQLLSELRNK